MADRMNLCGFVVGAGVANGRSSTSADVTCSRFGGLTRRHIMGPKKVDEKVEESSETPEKGFWQKFDDSMWDFFYGGKEKKWSPKKTGEAFDRRKSTLSWGREQNVMSSFGLTEDFLASLGDAEDEKAKNESPQVFVTESSLKGSPDSESYEDALTRLADWSDVPKDENLRLLDGRSIAELCFSKYGKYHDIDIFQAQPFGTEHRQVSFNIYYAALGDSNFPYSEGDYLSKLDTVASLLNSVDQSWYVRKFLREAIKPRRGLPSTPKWDTAVALRLNTSPTWKYVPTEVIDQFFSW